MGILTRRDLPEPEDEGNSFQPASYNTPRAITASAAKVDLKNKKEVDAIQKRRQTDKWQEEAWDYYDLIGEIKYSANIVANVLSRINLFPAYVENSGSIPSDLDSVEDKLEEGYADDVHNALHLLESGNGGTSGLLRDAALNLFTVGECYLVREPARYSTGEPEKWQIRSIDEITSTKGRNATVAIKPRRDSKPNDYIPLPKDGYISRLWKTHPRYADEADSSMRGLLDLCDELLLLGRTSRASAKSRLSSGMLFMPDGLSNATQSDSDDEEAVDAEEPDSFEEELIDAMVTPIADEGSASAVVPLVVRGPEDLGDKIKYFKFERAIDPQIIQRAGSLLDRILSGLDIPKDMAAGLSNVKYSNGVIIEEQLYKIHVEPLILMIVDCLTVGFLRPAMRSLGYDEGTISRTVVWYDPSNITAKPSKAEAATTGYEIGAVSHETWRRANGFAESDAPSPEEVAQRLAKEKGLLSEALTEKLISMIIPDGIESATREAQLEESGESAEALENALGSESESEVETPSSGPDTGEAPPSGLLEPGA